MPSVSPAQHRWIGWLHSNPEAREHAGMSKAKVDEWLHADKGSPWKRADGGYAMPTRSPDREHAGEVLSRGRVQSPQTDINLTPPPEYGAPGGPLDTKQGIDWLPQHMGPDTTKIDHPGAYRTANGGIVPRYDDGGAMPQPSIGGPTPAQTANPLQQGMVQRYSSLPTEKLQELAARLGGTPQSGMIQSLLRQRQMMPQQAPQPQAPVQQPMQQAAQPGQGFRRGGAPKRDMGGMSMSTDTPWWTRSEARDADSGLLHGTTPGQADAIKTTAPAGGFVVPAEVVAHLGQGNTLAGSRVMQSILDTGPGGMPLQHHGGGRGPPRPPELPRSEQQEFKRGGAPMLHGRKIGPDQFETHLDHPVVPVFPAKARGGGEKVEHGKTPVDLSDGEFFVSPHHVTAWGGGDHDSGIRIWNKWTWRKHLEHLESLKGYKGPVGIKKEDKKAVERAAA